MLILKSTHAKVHDLNNFNFDKAMAGDDVWLVQLYSTYCPECHKIKDQVIQASNMLQVTNKNYDLNKICSSQTNYLTDIFPLRIKGIELFTIRLHCIYLWFRHVAVFQNQLYWLHEYNRNVDNLIAKANLFSDMNCIRAYYPIRFINKPISYCII